MTDFDVGGRLRELRITAGMSQRQLAEAANVPHGQISMIETNKSSPSVSSLRKILSGLDISMSDFFDTPPPRSGEVFFTPSQLRDLTSRLFPNGSGGAGKITLKQVGDARAHGLQILHETYEAGADTGAEMLQHDASEGGVVICGEIEVTVADQVCVLKAGDAFLFRSNQPHRFRNISDRQAVVISACAPPYL